MIVFFCIKCVYDTGGIYTELAQSKSIEVEIFVLFFFSSWLSEQNTVIAILNGNANIHWK